MALGKFLRAKKVSKSALESPAMDAVMSLSRLELSRFDLISRLVRASLCSCDIVLLVCPSLPRSAPLCPALSWFALHALVVLSVLPCRHGLVSTSMAAVCSQVLLTDASCLCVQPVVPRTCWR